MITVSIKSKIVIGFAVSTLVAMLIGAMGISGVVRLSEEINQLTTRTYVLQQDAFEVESHVGQVLISEKRYLLEQNPSVHDRGVTALDAVRAGLTSLDSLAASMELTQLEGIIRAAMTAEKDYRNLYIECADLVSERSDAAAQAAKTATLVTDSAAKQKVDAEERLTEALDYDYDRRVIDIRITQMNIIQQIAATINQAQVQLMQFIHTQQPDMGKLAEATALSVEPLLDELKKETGNRSMLAAIDGQQKEVMNFVKNVQTCMDTTVTLASHVARMSSLSQEIIDKARTVAQTSSDIAAQAAEADAAMSRTSIRNMGLLLCGGLILSIFLAGIMIRRIIGPIRALVDAAGHIRNGNIDIDLTTSSRDEIGRIYGAFGSIVETLRSIIGQVGELTQACEQGELSYRGNVSAFDGVFQEMVQRMNQMMDKVATPVHNAIGMMERLSVNDMTGSMDENCTGDYLLIAKAANNLRDRFLLLQHTAEHIAEGSLEDLAAYREMGKLSEADRLTPSFIAMMESLENMITDVESLARAGIAGQLQVRADASGHRGVFCTIIEEFNANLDAVSVPLTKAAACIRALGSGILPEPIAADFKGEFETLKNDINQCIGAIGLLIQDVQQLAEAGQSGDLSFRADPENHEGAFRQIVEGINHTMDAVIDPLDETANALNAAAENDLTIRVNGEYNGRLAELKANVNSMLDNLSEALSQVSDTAGQVHEGAQQINDASQQLAEGATRQASSLQEISSSMTQISHQANENANEAHVASREFASVQRSAGVGEKEIEMMGQAMQAIQESGQQIAKINKVIDDIAFQTNLLALNAAVEAARAGTYGKGFAVVADEVRNLAGRSAKAAKETAELIDETVNRVEAGQQSVHAVSATFQSMVGGISKSSEHVQHIADASREQAEAVSQIQIGMEQIDQVTQQTMAGADETAQTAGTLDHQSTQLTELISRFKCAAAHEAEKFQPLELSAKKLPMIGRFPEKSSNDWNF